MPHRDRYHGSPQNVVDSLPSLLNNIRMMQSIARYYNTPDRMTTLFCKVTNQMIHNCKDHILGGGKIWDQVRFLYVYSFCASEEGKMAHFL